MRGHTEGGISGVWGHTVEDVWAVQAVRDNPVSRKWESL